MATGTIWDEREHVVALYLFRFGPEDLGLSYQEIADVMGRSPDSLIMRFSNFLHAENSKHGLDGGGHKAYEVYAKYKDSPKAQLRRIALKALLNKAKRSGT